jgi:lipopolysaccharide export system permease protein
MHFTLSLYLIKRFLKSIALVYAIILITFFVIDFAETYKHLYRGNVTVLYVMSSSLLKVPFVVQESFALVILISSIYLFFKLSKTNEYTALKSSGISTAQFLAPILTTLGILSIILLTTINPIATRSLLRQDKVESKLINPENRITAVFESGVWLIDPHPEEGYKLVINTEKIKFHKYAELDKTSILYIGNDFKLIKIIDAAYASLNDGHWNLHNATEIVPRQEAKTFAVLQIPTTLQPHELRNNFITPHKTSIWDLPYLIHLLQNTGNQADAYIAHFNKLLLKPFIAMLFVCCAAMFLLRPQRHSKSFDLALKSLILGFSIHITIEFLYVVGSSVNIPAYLTSAALMSFIALSSILFVKRSQL